MGGERIRNAGRGLLCAALLAPVALAAGKRHGTVEDLLVHGAVEGRSLGEWTAQWWRWAFSQPVAPYLDPDGSWCAMGQEGPVWFLAGTNGQFTPKRHCVVPEGKYLLVPIINMSMRRSKLTRAGCREMQESVAVNNNHLASAVVMVNGQLLRDARRQRVRSDGCFQFDPEDETSMWMAADGYWLMLKPLPRGRHTISVGANYGAPGDEGYGSFQQTFEYQLDVGGHTLLSDAGSAQPVTALR